MKCSNRTTQARPRCGRNDVGFHNFAPGTNFALNTPLAATLGAGGSFITDPNIGPIQITGGAGIVNSGLVSAVPEASTWAMMLIGFGVIGGALRRRQRGAGVLQMA